MQHNGELFVLISYFKAIIVYEGLSLLVTWNHLYECKEMTIIKYK